MFSLRLRHLPSLLGCGLATALSPVRACGPDFPNAYLATSAQTLADLPTLSFPAELARVFPAERPAPGHVAGGNADAEQAEIREVLAPLVSHRKLESLLAQYQREAPPRQLPAEFQLYAAG